ncbi:MAG: ATP-binding protein [Rhodothermales bacterium]
MTLIPDPSISNGDAEDEARRNTRLISTIFYITLVASFIVVLIQLWDELWLPALAISSLIPTSLICLWLIRKGHLTIPQIVLPTLFLALLTFLLIQGNGIHDIAIIGYPLIIIFAGMLMGPNRAWLFASLCSLSVALVAYVEMQRAGEVTVAPEASLEDVAIIILVLFVCAAMIWIITRYLNRSMALAVMHEKSLAQSNTRLRELIDELESKNAELERFTYTVSHDLKSPLITINGFIGLVEQDALSGNTEGMIRGITEVRRASERMYELLNDLLELSRIGRVVNPPETVPFEAIVQAALTAVEGPLRQHNVQVEVKPDLPMVFGDRQRLTEVLQNLIENAVKFSSRGSDPRIEIGACRKGTKTEFYVRDNGMGIAPRYHEQIFDLFTRLDQDVEGTGIGLAVAKRIIELHHGRIWVESEGPGHGATFCFTLNESAQAEAG